MKLTPQFSFPDLRLASVTLQEGRHLPRWEASGAVYHVAIHLNDSVPADQRRIWQDTRLELQTKIKTENRALSPAELDELKSVYNERVEKYLASGYGSCLLRHQTVQMAMKEILAHGNGKNYALHVWCLMPNHLHVIVGSFAEDKTLTQTITNWKRISGHTINKLLNRVGPVWQSDSYTRIIRTLEEYKAQLNYVWLNPESAGLTEGFVRDKFVEV